MSLKYQTTAHTGLGGSIRRLIVNQSDLKTTDQLRRYRVYIPFVYMDKWSNGLWQIGRLHYSQLRYTKILLSARYWSYCRTAFY